MTFPAYGQTGGLNACQSGGYVLAYFNGVNTTFIQAGVAIIRLGQLYGQNYNNEQLLYRRFHNPTDGFLRDLAESFRQKELEQPAIRGRWELFFQILRGLDPGAGLSDLVREGSKLYAEKLIAQAAPQPIVDNFVATMQSLLAENRKIVAVAHSQGNLFLNSVYDKVKATLATNSLIPVHVATPAATTRGSYATSSSDQVINAIRLVLGNTLPSTINIPIANATPFDPLGHSFVEIYLQSALPALQQIQGYINTALQTVQSPASAGNGGLFTVTLTWNGGGDVDLHAFEPSGSHVYYANTQGPSGFLDVDNISANGPEHYSVRCDVNTIQIGVYGVGINNFANATGRTATVKLTAIGRDFNAVTLGVGDARGAGGDSSPIHVFNVRVVKNEDGTYRVTQE
jgi:uncharacterized protein YfaP (DUF2135 family)